MQIGDLSEHAKTENSYDCKSAFWRILRFSTHNNKEKKFSKQYWFPIVIIA